MLYERYLTVNETTELLSISRSFLLRLVKDHKIPYLSLETTGKKKRNLRFPENRIHAMIHSNKI